MFSSIDLSGPSEHLNQFGISLLFADGTIEQLKNVGGFRLIKSKEVTEKIKNYLKGQKRIKEQGIGMDQRMQQLLTEKSRIMYARVFDYTGNVLEGKSIVTLKSKKLNKIQAKTGSKFLSNDLKELIKLSNISFLFIGQLYVYWELALSQQQQATDLIKLIQAEIK